jgi:hypothetical protein
VRAARPHAQRVRQGIGPAASKSRWIQAVSATGLPASRTAHPADSERLLTSWARLLADSCHPGRAVAHAERLSTSRRRTPPCGASPRRFRWPGSSSAWSSSAPASACARVSSCSEARG